MSKKEHALSFMLPITVAIVVPILLMYLSLSYDPWFVWPPVFNIIYIVTGILVIIAGIILLYGTIRMFAQIGQGTLSPLHPTQYIVAEGVYSHVRNPMIIGVLLILLGESILFYSILIFGWCLFFFIGNHVYFIKSEEPGLEKRFGEGYLIYKKNVPRWIPRRTPWSPPFPSGDDQVP